LLYRRRCSGSSSSQHLPLFAIERHGGSIRPKLSAAEIGAIQAIARGATDLRMTSRIEARLLELGLICRPGRGFAVTAAGQRAGNPLSDDWL
jgi:hypothetical protein